MSEPIIATFEVEYDQPDNAAGDYAAAVVAAMEALPFVKAAEQTGYYRFPPIRYGTAPCNEAALATPPTEEKER